LIALRSRGEEWCSLQCIRSTGLGIIHNGEAELDNLLESNLPQIVDLDEIAKTGLKNTDDIWGMYATRTVFFFDHI
jgi:hypothetical protein